MRVSRPSADQLILHLGTREKRMLLHTLHSYPMVPLGHYQFSKGGGVPDQENNQRLLEESLQEQRLQNKRELEVLLRDPARLVETQAGCELRLTPMDVEWLLQVFNDIRVGSWIKLGSPEARIHKLTPKTARDVFTMELAGYFQMALLEGLSEQ